MGQHLQIIETTIEILVNKLDEIILNLHIAKDKFVKQINQVSTRPNSDITEFKLRNISPEILQVFSKQFKVLSFKF